MVVRNFFSFSYRFRENWANEGSCRPSQQERNYIFFVQNEPLTRPESFFFCRKIARNTKASLLMFAVGTPGERLTKKAEKSGRLVEVLSKRIYTTRYDFLLPLIFYEAVFSGRK